jgi:hypothetical protein
MPPNITLGNKRPILGKMLLIAYESEIILSLKVAKAPKNLLNPLDMDESNNNYRE